jgi:hypothetical protein
VSEKDKDRMLRKEHEREKQLQANKKKCDAEFDDYVNMIERVFTAANPCRKQKDKSLDEEEEKGSDMFSGGIEFIDDSNNPTVSTTSGFFGADENDES